MSPDASVPIIPKPTVDPLLIQRTVYPSEILIDQNQIEPVHDRAALVGRIVALQVKNSPKMVGPVRIIKVARSLGETAILVETQNESRIWWSLQIILAISVSPNKDFIEYQHYV